MADTPKIRFKGYTDAWEQRKLSDLIIEYKETVDSDCTLPVLTSSKTEGVVLQEEHFGRVQNHDITGYNILPRNYCTYRNRSDGVDFTFNINRCCDKGIISKFYPVFYGNNSDIFFISMVLNYCDEVVHEIAYTCTGTGQKVLSFLDLQKMNIRVPSYDEQKKISQYFEQLDNLITLHQRKCDETKTLKKYMLQKMFPKNGATKPEIRFSGFTDDWEQRKFGDDIESIQTGTNLLGSESKNGTPLLKMGNIQRGYFDISKVEYLDESDTVEPENIAYYGDFFFNTRNTMELVGKGATWLGDSGKYAFNSNIARFKFKDIDTVFFNYLYNTEDMKKQIHARATGTTSVAAIYPRALETVEYYVPSREEQSKIGTLFIYIDNLITLHQRKCDELKELKKYMLQNMFV
ncbi:MAG: restriction endonuclease subunit S [Lachnospiraceae bacterium]|nr:restriction endonuclease subunit S [Lachnospiraceae bacterium]